VLVGSIRNLPALAAEVGQGTVDTPEHVLALAFERWGVGALPRLRGSFALAAWNRVAKRGLLAVDQLGAGGLFVHESHGRLAFATEIRNLVRLLPARPGPDAEGVVQWVTAGCLRRGRTLLEGVRRLEGGQFVRLSEGGWKFASYWSPRYAAPLPLGGEELAASLRSHLERAVRQRMAGSGKTGGTTGVLLSGGFDSSTVASVARRVEPVGATVSAYSLVFPDHSEADESSLIEEVASVLRMPSQRTPIRSASSLRPALEFQCTWELPAASPTLFFNLPLLRRAAREGVSVMLDGEGGDELFGCSPYLIADCLRRGDLRRAVALVRRLPDVGAIPLDRLWWLMREYGLKGAAPHTLHRAARRLRPVRYVPDWLRPESAQLYVDSRGEWDWKHGSGPRWWAFLSYLLTTWRERAGVYDFLRRRAELAGLESRHPLLDDLDLIEFVLRLPPDLAFDPDINRPFARAAVSGLVPDAIRLRGAKGDLSPLFVEVMSAHDTALAAELLTDSHAEIWAYARPEKIRDLLARPLERRDVAWAWQVWRLATTECWLRSQSDPGFARRLIGV
jgi:asparagine synthase (glutamine-hydrolysing)